MLAGKILKFSTFPRFELSVGLKTSISSISSPKNIFCMLHQNNQEKHLLYPLYLKLPLENIPVVLE